jgi:hypothetical protein
VTSTHLSGSRNLERPRWANWKILFSKDSSSRTESVILLWVGPSHPYSEKAWDSISRSTAPTVRIKQQELCETLKFYSFRLTFCSLLDSSEFHGSSVGSILDVIHPIYAPIHYIIAKVTDLRHGIVSWFRFIYLCHYLSLYVEAYPFCQRLHWFQGAPTAWWLHYGYSRIITVAVNRGVNSEDFRAYLR